MHMTLEFIVHFTLRMYIKFARGMVYISVFLNNLLFMLITSDIELVLCRLLSFYVDYFIKRKRKTKEKDNSQIFINKTKRKLLRRQ